MLQFSVRSAQLSKGYEAFNRAKHDSADDDPDWKFIRALFCQDSGSDAEGKPEFPLWYPEHDPTQPKKGQQEIIDHLRTLRQDNQAELWGVFDDGNKSIIVDFTSPSPEGPHLCADEVEFDESGLIKVFKHCTTATHKNPPTASGTGVAGNSGQ
jgi:hypothetical protein